MGAWIETGISNDPYGPKWVAPYMGAWIETLQVSNPIGVYRRSLYGSVD